jgi:hypothetical protein
VENSSVLLVSPQDGIHEHSAYGSLDFLEQEIDRQKLSGVTFLAEPFTESDGKVCFPTPVLPRIKKFS